MGLNTNLYRSGSVMHASIIDAHELTENLNNPFWVIVDCRYDLSDPDAGYRAYLESHIPGAVYVDLNNDLSGPAITDHGRHPMPAADRMNNLFSSLGISNDSLVVAYDASCGSLAARLWWMLRYMGHAGVSVLDGGWQAWLEAGFGVEQEERRNSETSFNGVPQRDRLVELKDVLSSPLLIDAREPARYRGEQEPIDPVAGHIPGAVNLYWRKNLDEQGRFLPPRRLMQQYLNIYAGVAPQDAVFYCGSGVTACHDILAAVHAGLPRPRLYAGSWSEWCSDPDRPIATEAG